MSKLFTVSVTLSALALVSASYAVDPATAVRHALQDSKVQAKTAQWSLPYAFDANLRPRGGFASVGGYYATYKGRKMEMREIIAGVDITDAVRVWVGSQAYVVKGRQSTSRFHVSDDLYGVRWVVKPAKEAGDPSIALEFQATIPGTARATVGNSSATYNATKNNSFAVDYGLPSGLQTQLSYTSVKGAALGDANVFGLGAAKDFSLKDKLTLRVQGTLIGQSYTDAVEHVDLELKPVLYAAVGYEAVKGIRLEGDATVLPAGVPLGGTHFQGLSGFEIYRPGGVAGELRNNFVAFASIRLVFHSKF